jgi:tetratricopeptide (TPR) repeat protein
MSKDGILDITLVPYMQTLMINDLKFKNVTDDEIMRRYDVIMKIIDTKLKTATGNTAQRLEDYKNQIDDILIKIVDVNCDFINNNLIPKYKEDPSDLLLAQKIFQFMLKANCTDNPFWLEIGEAIFNGGKKDFGLGKNIAVRYIALGNYSKAQFYLKEILSLAPADSDKCDVYIMLGGIESKKGNKSGARDYYRQCIAANPGGSSEAYERIGDLYYSSFEECAKKEKMAEDRLVFIAAYEMYSKAQNNQKMAQARAQFPSVEEIFTEGWSEGDAKHVGCWIGENVTLRTRPKDQ